MRKALALAVLLATPAMAQDGPGPNLVIDITVDRP